jgi:beta-lactamase regulating signal transducer with metallopeptidase domain
LGVLLPVGSTLSSAFAGGSAVGSGVAETGFRGTLWNIPVSDGVAFAVALVLLAAALGRAAWLGAAVLAAHRWRNEAAGTAPDRIARWQRVCEQALGLEPVEALPNGRLAGPVTVGVTRPVILLPADFGAAESDDAVRAALGHELAHVRRRDYGWNLLYEAALLPFVWHPAAAYLRRQIDRTREMACDEMVAEKVLEGKRYARSLVEIAAKVMERDERWALALGITDGDILGQRVKRLLAARAPAFSPRVAVAALALAAAAGVAAVAGRVETQNPETLKVEQQKQKEQQLKVEQLKRRGIVVDLGKAPAPPPPPPPPPPSAKVR